MFTHRIQYGDEAQICQEQLQRMTLQCNECNFLKLCTFIKFAYFPPIVSISLYLLNMIYFDVTTLDLVINDRAAKFVDMLAAFGGTMGLLTGFSIITVVEILYFGIQIIFEFLNNRLNRKNNEVTTVEKISTKIT